MANVKVITNSAGHTVNLFNNQKNTIPGRIAQEYSHGFIIKQTSFYKASDKSTVTQTILPDRLTQLKSFFGTPGVLHDGRNVMLENTRKFNDYTLIKTENKKDGNCTETHNYYNNQGQLLTRSQSDITPFEGDACGSLPF